jgi:SWI/SNF-related matrix-associated actin-dependent regulator of chromatin subfamily A-like protein 1
MEEIIAPSGRKATPYQVEGINFLASKRYASLNDEPGLGKTFQAIMAADRAFTTGAPSILIICPVSAVAGWRREIGHGAPRSVYGQEEVTPSFKGPFAKIVTFDFLSQEGNAQRVIADTRRPHVIIIDEAHRLKAEGSNRTKSVYGKLRAAWSTSCVWTLSGTLAPNHPGELYTHIKALYPQVFGEMCEPWKSRTPDYNEFVEYLCHTKDSKYGMSVTGVKSAKIPALRNALSPHMLRRRKSQVLPDMPPMFITDEPLTITEDLQGVAPILTVATKVSKLDGDELLEALFKSSAAVMSERKALGLAKVKAAADWIEELLEAGTDTNKKVIVFAYHKEVCQELLDRLLDYGACLVTGDTPQELRDRAEFSFQNGFATRVFIGQIDATSEAITLTAASDVVIVEPSWVPSVNHQAACRAHRFGQTEPVFVRYLYAPGTIDEKIMQAFRRKAEDLAKVFD